MICSGTGQPQKIISLRTLLLSLVTPPLPTLVVCLTVLSIPTPGLTSILALLVVARLCCSGWMICRSFMRENIRIMGYIPKLDKSIDKCIVISKNEYTAFVEDTIQLVINQFVNKNLLG